MPNSPKPKAATSVILEDDANESNDKEIVFNTKYVESETDENTSVPNEQPAVVDSITKTLDETPLQGLNNQSVVDVNSSGLASDTVVEALNTVIKDIQREREIQASETENAESVELKIKNKGILEETNPSKEVNEVLPETEVTEVTTKLEENPPTCQSEEPRKETTLGACENTGSIPPSAEEEEKAEPKNLVSEPAIAVELVNSESFAQNLEVKAEETTSGLPGPVTSAVTVDRGEPAGEPQSPPIVPRGTYQFDFDNFNEFSDPFNTKSKTGNSPIKAKLDSAELNPFKSTSTIPNSLPMKDSKGYNIDPIKQGNHISDSPPTKDTSGLPDNLPVVSDKKPQESVPEKLEEVKEELESVKTSQAVVNSRPKQAVQEAEIDPFKPTKAITDSPVQQKSEEDFDNIDPFQPRKTMENSPVLKKLEVNFDDIDPFKPRKAMANSPVEAATDITEAEIDPFKPTKAVAKSPEPRKEEAMEAEVDPFQPTKAIENTPLSIKADKNEVEIDPFKPTKAVAKSPVKAKPEENLDSIDPFNPRKVMANSPIQSKTKESDANMDPFKPKKAIANSPPPTKTDISGAEQDPFKPCNAISNSPPSKADFNEEEIDPFNPRKTMANSPPSKPDVNFDDIDPFKPSKAMMNSPPQSKANVIEEEIDPFKPKKAIANSPVGQKTEVNKSDEPEKDENDENVAPEDQPKSAKKTIRRKKPAAKAGGPKRTRFKPPPHFAKKSGSDDAIQIFMPGEKPAGNPSPEAPANDSNPTSDKPKDSSDHTPSEAKEDPATAETTTNAPPARENTEPAQAAATDNFLDDPDIIDPSLEEFVPASDFLNDSASWDFLNKCGSSESDKASELTRQSLYVKFDPLVKGQTTQQVPVPQQPLLLNETATWDMLNQYGPSEAKSTGRESLFVRFDPLVKATSPALPRAVARLKPAVEPQPKTGDLLMMTTPPNAPKAAAVPSISSLQQPSLPTPNLSFSPSTLPQTPAVAMKKTSSSEDAKTSDIVEVIQYSQADMDRLREKYELQMSQMQTGLELDFQAKLLSREQAFAEEKKQLQDIVKVERKKQEEMVIIVEEYEMSLSKMCNTQTTSDAQVTDLTSERDQALEDLKKMESTFYNLLSRFEKTKESVEAFKKNEEELKKYTADVQGRLKKQEQKYTQLKQKAEEKLEAMSKELKKVQDEHKMEVARLQASIKKFELQKKSLDQQLEQKANENKELTAICDELLQAAKANQ